MRSTGTLAAAFAAALLTAALPAAARDLTITSWGGAYQNAQRELYFAPFQKETGIKLVEDTWDGGIGVLRTKAQGTPVWDVVQVETDELVLGCEEGILEPLDWQALGGKDKFLPAAVHECGVGAIVWATILAYDGNKFPTGGPASWADFFDTQKFPGKRALRKGPRQALEFATMAQGVPPAKVYEALRAPGGIDKAFAKLDSIKKDLIFWEAGAQPPQLLASGEVAMTSAYNGRITAANRQDKRNFKIAWNAGFVYQIDSWVILKNSPKKAEAFKLVQYLTRPENQAKLPAIIPYGPTHVDGGKLVPAEFAADIPSSPQNLPHGVFFDASFWVENVEKLTERFNAWAAQK
jgi:putative spermidine/putrescine transport system substrate-binding protein